MGWLVLSHVPLPFVPTPSNRAVSVMLILYNFLFISPLSVDEESGSGEASDDEDWD